MDQLKVGKREDLIDNIREVESHIKKNEMRLDDIDKDRRSKWSLGIAVEVVAIADTKDITVSLVKSNAIGNSRVLTSPTLQPSVDDVGDGSIPLKPTRRPVPGRGRPSTRDDVMARRLVVLRCHPKPYGRLEGGDRIPRHQLARSCSCCITTLILVF